MSWQSQSLGGPVLAWEIKRATRRTLGRWLQVGYCGWLFLQALALLTAVEPSIRVASATDQFSRLEIYAALHEQMIVYLDHYLLLVLQFQLVIVLAFIPAVTASSLGQEKERGTLFALFGTELTSRQILLGKLLGRLIVLTPLVLTPVPAMVFIAILSGRGLTVIILALVQEFVVGLALGAVCLLLAIWIRRAVDAVIASYLFLGLGCVLIRGFSYLPGAHWLDPVRTLDELLRDGSWLAFLANLATWALVGVLCLRLGWGRLRKVCVEQRDKKPSRRLWAFRPPVGNNAIRWRECYVIGLAPMPILRIVPRWLALLGVFTFSAAVAGLIAENESPGVLKPLWRMDVVEAYRNVASSHREIKFAVPLLGALFVLSANVLVGLRCGTSVAEEKRRNTWDDLLLTAQSFREITNGKMWGVLQAIVPYIVAYALPMLFIASLGGPGTLLAAGVWIVAPCAIVLTAALMDIDMIQVPPEMDETRKDGAFWFEKAGAERRPDVTLR